MLQFAVQHVDAIITTLGGILASHIGYKAADSSQRTKILRILGPCVVLFGLLRFAIDDASPVEWRRVFTSDNVASVEFPGTPEINDLTQTLHGQTITTHGWKYAVPDKDVSLQISFSEVPESETKVPQGDRIAFTKQFFLSKNMKLMGEGTKHFGETSGFYFDLETGDGKVRMWTRIAYVGLRIYRIVASSGPDDFDEPVVLRFIESFKIHTQLPPR